MWQAELLLDAKANVDANSVVAAAAVATDKCVKGSPAAADLEHWQGQRKRSGNASTAHRKRRQVAAGYWMLVD